MRKGRIKLFLFRLIFVLMVVFALELIGYLAMRINSRSFDYLSNKNYLFIRAMLMGNKSPELLPRYLSLPYLGYIPYPGYTRHGILQHNEDGYRGERVPLEKTNKFRILCLGGSTTYGLGVDSPSQTFPAQLEHLLNSHIHSDSLLRRKYHGAEVINAGLEGGNTAEELQQYLFKYRYYRPDVVVVHSGVNDAQQNASNTKDFQLDYTSFRRINFDIEPLTEPAKFMMKSYLISFIAIRLFYTDFADAKGNEFQRNPRQPFCKWTTINEDSLLGKNQFQYYPFYQNTMSLYQKIINDSAMLVSFPNVLDTAYVKMEDYKKLCGLNASISKLLCNKFAGIYVGFDFDSIKAEYWIDDCHVNAKGEKRKAEILYPYLVKILDRDVRRE